jgi:glycosyltransferase involved in cell wall biosynthesis
MIDYSIVIPAYNEEAYLPRTLAAIKRAMAKTDQRGELIVVDNNSGDRTADIARNHGARVVHERINQISKARNAGAAAAEGRHLIFVDADTLISARLLQAALGHLASNAVCGGGSTIAPDKPLKPMLRHGLRLWNRLSVMFNVAAGSFIYCRRDGFRAVGGFSETVFVGEELWFSLAYQKWGRRRGQSFRILSHAPVVTSTRKLEWFTPYQTLLMLISMVFFPLISRNRNLCRYWYVRPPPAQHRADERREERKQL